MQILSLLKDEDRLIEAGSLGNTGGFGVDGSNRLSGGDASRVLARVASAAAAMARWGRSRRRRRGGSRGIGRTVGVNEWTGGGGSSGCKVLTNYDHRSESIRAGANRIIWNMVREVLNLIWLHRQSAIDECMRSAYEEWIREVHHSGARVVAIANPV